MKKTLLLVFAALMMVACNCSGDHPQKELEGPKDPDPVQTDPQPDPEPDPAQEPTEADPVTYRIGTYNVGVFSKSGTNTTEMVAAMMKEIGVQVLSMNELTISTAGTTSTRSAPSPLPWAAGTPFSPRP